MQGVRGLHHAACKAACKACDGVQGGVQSGVQGGMRGVQGVVGGQGVLDSTGTLLTLSWSHFRNLFLFSNHGP